MLQLLGALLVGAIFAKIISTANNYLFSPATNLVNDIFVRYIRPKASNKQILLVSPRSWSSCSASGRSIKASHTESVLKKALYAYTIYSAALTPVILAAFYWRRATASAAVASIFTGTVVTVIWDTAFIHAHLPARHQPTATPSSRRSSPRSSASSSSASSPRRPPGTHLQPFAGTLEHILSFAFH